jgi:hypothetical protein
VLRRLVDGLGLVVGWGRAEVPHTTSIAHARDRLGWETVRELFRRFATMLRERFSAADRWKDLFVYVIDGTGLRTADTKANEAEFGRPGGGRGKSAFPQFRGVLLMGAWSHLVLGGLFGHWRMGELTLATHMLDQIPTGSLLLVDRLYLDRWEIELGIRELKCVLGANSKPTFRSHEPDRVKQETYGLLVAYNCVRALMAEAAEEKGIQPRRLSFTDCLAQIRVFLPIMAHVDASLVRGLYEAMLDALAACELPPGRKGRTCPREVKTKMSNYKKKRSKAA